MGVDIDEPGEDEVSGEIVHPGVSSIFGCGISYLRDSLVLNH
jgi:hypothetical protein